MAMHYVRGSCPSVAPNVRLLEYGIDQHGKQTKRLLVPCAVVDCQVATTLDNAFLEKLKRRKLEEEIKIVDDFEYHLDQNPNNRPTYFGIPSAYSAPD